MPPKERQQRSERAVAANNAALEVLVRTRAAEAEYRKSLLGATEGGLRLE